MFLLSSLPESYEWCMKTNLIMKGEGRGWDAKRTYFWVELVDELDSRLQISPVYRVSDLYSFLDATEICFGLDIGFCSEFFGSRWIAFCDEVVHDQVVYITVQVERQLLPADFVSL